MVRVAAVTLSAECGLALPSRWGATARVYLRGRNESHCCAIFHRRPPQAHGGNGRSRHDGGPQRPEISWLRRRYPQTRDFRSTGKVAGMSLVEWLRTPRYLKTRLMMETRPLSRAEMEVVFLEVRGGSARVRLPVMLFFLPKGPRSSRDLTSPPEDTDG
jgi:hypothetical protein